MSDLVQKARNFVAAKDSEGLEALLARTDSFSNQLKDELRLALLVKQEAAPAELERSVDHYLSNYGDVAPTNNLLVCARVKFQLKEFEKALALSARVLDESSGHMEAAELAAISLFNLDKHDKGRRLVKVLRKVHGDLPKIHEWNILFSFRTAEYQEVVESWEHLMRQKIVPDNLDNIVSFVVRAYLYVGLPHESTRIVSDYNLEMKTTNVDVGMTVAEYHKQLGNYSKAEETLRYLIRNNPEIPELKWNLSLVLMLSGKVEEAWDFHEHRWEWKNFPSTRRKFDAPMWDSTFELKGKRLLIWGEQGIGDQLRFLTLLPNLLQQTPDCLITLEVDPKSVGFVKIWYPEIEVWGFGDADTTGQSRYAKFDFQISSGSLPKIYFNTLTKMTNSKFRRLTPTKEQKAECLGSFHDRHDIVVGFSWRSRLLLQNRIDDYIDAKGFRELITQFPDNIGFVCLQYDINEEEKKIFEDINNVLLPDEDFLNDVKANALYAGSCDLLVTVGTVVATLAGIFGVPVISWSRQDDAVNLGQKYNPWFPNRLDFRTQPNWDKAIMIDRLRNVLKKFLYSQELEQ